MGNRIKELREQANMRQVDLANAVGIDQRTISNYETGKTDPDSFALIRIADFFHVTIDYLVGRTDYNAPSEKETDNLLRELAHDIDRLHGTIHGFMQNKK